MIKKQSRRLPDGIPSFQEIRNSGCIYVDKTDLAWQIANGSKFNYLCRPRRFGKSILLDTIACYFEGRKELFEGLKIMDLEENWTAHPVVRLDLSNGGATVSDLAAYLDNTFYTYEELYEIQVRPDTSLAIRFSNIITNAHKKTGQPVAVLIDEYDSPLQHSWHTPEHEGIRDVYRSVFAVLKSCSIHEQFVFITGITKFTQVSLFSVLNNLNNITFYPDYAAVCGITKQELVDNFMPEIERLGEKNGWTVEQTLEELRANYDGYHFSEENMIDVYNPFSIVSALARGRISNYWASSGATSLLSKFVDDMELRVRDLDNSVVPRVVLETSDVNNCGDAVFLYQSGYLTIKSVDPYSYFLGIPNHEVRQALYEVVLPALAMRKTSEIQNAQGQLLYGLNYIKLPEAMKTLKALIADVPYSNKKLQSIDMEERYRYIISCICYSLGLHVEVEHMMAKGRIDLVVWAYHAIYVIELKLSKNGGIAAAEQQIRDNLYAEPFKGDAREVVALAIELDDEGKGLLDWKRVE